MKRRLRITVVFFLLGAIVNVAVAWCMTLIEFDAKEQRFHGVVPSMLVTKKFGCVQIAQGFPAARPSGTVYLRTFDPRLIIPSESAFANGDYWHKTFNRLPADAGLRSIEERLIGWPCLSLRNISIESGQARNGSWLTSVKNHGRINTPKLMQSLGFPQQISSLPAWPGFAPNTIFYAAILWVLFFAPGAVRRNIRRRRGLCPACAYPIGTSPVCTECGKSVLE
jgi:hypothetical protein